MRLYWKLNKSRWVLVAGGLATLLCLAVLAVYRRQMPPWQLGLTLVLAAGVCLGATWFAAGMVASACQQSMLEQLHLKLQPDAFVAAYAPVAEAALQTFARQVESLRESNPPLAENLQGDVERYQTWLGLLTGHTADCGVLEQKMQQLPTKLAKLDVCWMLLLASRAARDEAAEKRYEALFRQEGGNLAAARTLRGAKAAEG